MLAALTLLGPILIMVGGGLILYLPAIVVAMALGALQRKHIAALSPVKHWGRYTYRGALIGLGVGFLVMIAFAQANLWLIRPRMVADTWTVFQTTAISFLVGILAAQLVCVWHVNGRTRLMIWLTLVHMMAVLMILSVWVYWPLAAIVLIYIWPLGIPAEAPPPAG